MAQKAREQMAHYFTREEAEALLPQITVVLLQIQKHRQAMQQTEEELGMLHAQAMGNGHHLHGRIAKVQKELAQQLQVLEALVEELHAFGCELKDPGIGLIDFLSLRNGREVYLCWHLGEERINFWHYLDAGFAGRQPL
ncbi:MAG TPA: DUF2203 domain-containing protein [Ktedonobacteraceae bacterium]|jgi:hypothetical protein|nr:DUF2203 domain-containing protein [Ktedonobacteraceae bacterium]